MQWDASFGWGEVITIVSVAFGYWGVWRGWRHARRVAAQRATLDFISEYNIHNDNWMDNYNVCRGVLRKTTKEWHALLKVSSGGTDRDTDTELDIEQERELQKTYTVLNNFEIAAIGIRQGIIDESIYELWYRNVIVAMWKRARPFVIEARKARTDELFKQFQELAEKWEPSLKS